MKLASLLVCPDCKATLTHGPKAMKCTKCNREYLKVNEIPYFVKDVDDFYEGKFAASITKSNSLKDRVRHKILRRLRFLKEELDKIKNTNRLKILDIACGGGHELLKEYGDVIGLDISRSSLIQAKKLYGNVICADASKLPFSDETFDVVIAMDFLGHIPFEQKNSILNETKRVLKKGGTTLQYIETLGDNSMQNLARKHPKEYKEHFIDREGHIGLEPQKVVLERFHSLGLVPTHAIPAYKSWVKQPGEISGRFKGDYCKLHPWLHIPVLIDSAISFSTPTRFIGTAVLELLSEKIDKALPDNMADGLFLKAVRS